MSVHSGQSEGSARSTGSLSKQKSPCREGFLDVYQDARSIIGKVPWFSQAPLLKKEILFIRRWVVLRDCWIFIFANEREVNLGEGAESQTYDLRGCMCEIDPNNERTLRLETQSIALFASDIRASRSLLLRAKSEKDMKLWKQAIDSSSMWDVVLRAWAFQDCEEDAEAADSLPSSEQPSVPAPQFRLGMPIPLEV